MAHTPSVSFVLFDLVTEVHDSFFVLHVTVKKLNNPDYRHYLKLWNQESKTKHENTKDLPKLNQVSSPPLICLYHKLTSIHRLKRNDHVQSGALFPSLKCSFLQTQFIELCKTLYSMFSEDVSEQELYHATATVTSLLLEMGEVGKLFASSSSRRDHNMEGQSDTTDPNTPQEAGLDGELQQRDQGGEFVHAGLEDKASPCDEGTGDEGSRQLQAMQDIKLEDSSPKDIGTSSAMLISDDETKDDTSMSSYSVLSAGSHELDEKLQCEDIAEDTVLVRNDNGERGGGPLDRALPHSASIDKDWAITFEQFLASVLTEQALVHYFEKPVEVAARITNAKNVRKVGRPLLSTSDYEISLSG